MKLYRDNRQSLIIEKNLKRYLLYAAGEILLVMIGISLAFQLDNWNENRVKRNKEIDYYRIIRDQILDDKKLIQGQMDFNNFFRGEFGYANNLIELNDKSKMDTLGIIIRNMPEYSDFDREGNIYETLVNSGEIKILRNHDIVQGIRELEESYVYVNRMESIHYDVTINHVLEVIKPVIKFTTGEIKKPEVIYNYEFQNVLVMLLRVMKEKDEVYHKTLDQIQIVKNLIEEELNIES